MGWMGQEGLIRAGVAISQRHINSIFSKGVIVQIMKQRPGAGGRSPPPTVCMPADVSDELSGHFGKHRKSEESVWPVARADGAANRQHPP